MTVHHDLATLRRWTTREDARYAAADRVEAEFKRLRDKITRLQAEAKHGERAWEQMRERAEDSENARAAWQSQCEAAEAENARLEQENVSLVQSCNVAVRQAEAAEAEVARLRDGLREMQREEWTRLRSALIAVAGHLNTPYPDDPRWTPWTRFVEPSLQRMDEALRALRRIRTETCEACAMPAQDGAA